jgi:hypothetical protein
MSQGSPFRTAPQEVPSNRCVDIQARKRREHCSNAKTKRQQVMRVGQDDVAGANVVFQLASQVA